MRLILAILFVATAASADPKPFKYGSQWHELRSAHFIVDTDAVGPKVATLIQTLEKYEAQEISILVGGAADLPGRLRVLAFDNSSEYRDLAGRYVDGFYSRSEIYGPYIMLPMTDYAGDGETLAHELAHYISFFLFPAQPSWFAEGFAEWVQTIASGQTEYRSEIGSHIIHSSGARYSAGSLPDNLARALAYAPQVPAKDLLEWRGVEDASTPFRYHVWSWLLYHWLWNARSKPFADYEQRLMNGEDPAAAWKAAFPEFDPGNPSAMDKLDSELQAYRKGGRFLSVRLEAKADGAFTEAGPLSPADVHALIATVRRQGNSAEQERADLKESLSQDPLHPVALFRLNQADPPAAIAALRKTVAARPKDARAQFLLGHLLLQDVNQDPLPALRAAVALDPDLGRAHTDLAIALLRAGRAKEAIPVANRAVDLSPWDPAAVDSLAQAAAATGKCKESVALQKRELWLVDDKSQEKLRNRIAAQETSCGAAKPAAAGATGK